MRDIGIPQKELITIREDNQTAIKLAEDEMSHKRTKHIVVKYHYSKEQQDIGTISISYISLEDNLADFFTKPQYRVQHQQIYKRLGLFAWQSFSMIQGLRESVGMKWLEWVELEWNG
jgi:hypothetical protein